MNVQLNPSTGKRGFSVFYTSDDRTFGLSLSSVPTSVLQEKSVAPQKQAQVILPDKGYAGFSKVTVEAIPADYADVSSVTTQAEDVLEGNIFVDRSGIRQEGAMPNRAATQAVLDGIKQTSWAIPAGYHNGLGTVSLDNTIETALAAL